MPRTKAQYEAMRTATRDKIHTAAIRLFAQNGFASTGVQDIADLAGISTGLLYRHYNSKEDLFYELVIQAADGLAENVRAFRSDAPPVTIMRRLTQEILRDIAENEHFAQFLMLMNQASAMEQAPPQVRYLNEQSASMLNETALLIEKGQELGQFKQGNPMEMAIYYYAAVQGLTMAKLTMRERFTVPSPRIVTAFLFEEEDDGQY